MSWKNDKPIASLRRVKSLRLQSAFFKLLKLNMSVLIELQSMEFQPKYDKNNIHYIGYNTNTYYFGVCF